MPKKYFPQDEYEARWERVHAEMAARGIDIAVVWSRSAGTYDRAADVLYLANYYSPEAGPDTLKWRAQGTYAIILQTGETPELIADNSEQRNDHIATGRISRFDNPIAGVAERLAARGIAGEVALVGADVLALKYWHELKAATPAIAWVEVDDLIRIPRRIKSPRELDCLREGGRIGSAALDVMMKALVAGKPETEAVGEAAHELYRLGGAGSYITANHGDTIDHWAREPLLGRSADGAKPGEFVRGWMDAIYQGYWFDHGRTAVAGGKPSPAQRRLIDDCAAIIEGIIAAIRPGVTNTAVAEAGETIITEVGGEGGAMAEMFPVLAHGIGLYWEYPYVGRQAALVEETIEADMAMGVEYFLSREGVGTVGIEQNLIVGADGNEIITYLPIQGW
jgi:Xaa-Pro aminopeptidase